MNTELQEKALGLMGKTVTDCVYKLSGTVVSVEIHLNGCIQVQLEYYTKKDERCNSLWVDVQRVLNKKAIDIVENKKVTKEVPGGASRYCKH